MKERTSLIDALQTKDTFTENAMPTNSTTLDACVDFFASAGSARNWDRDAIIASFSKAMAEDPLVALRTLFYMRDVRGGAGERRLFRICTEYLDASPKHRKHLLANLSHVPEYGRWDDLFAVGGQQTLRLIREGLQAENGLLAKWLPRKGQFANKVRKFLDLTPKQYRKLIVALSKTVEQQMCAKDWTGITYPHVPSVAMRKYNKAFLRNDETRFRGFLGKVARGEATINADALFPYQLFQAWKRHEDQETAEAQWSALPDFMKGNKERVLPLCDTSGSMDCNYGVGINGVTPMDIAISLSIYVSERNEGLFKDTFMTFSARPTLQVLKGSLYDRCAQLRNAHWSMNTDLEAAFKAILGAAVKHKINEDEMPTTLLIMSDMQFDECMRRSGADVMEMASEMYAEAGYKLPQVVFWNLNARQGKFPVQFDQSGTAIISGASPSILAAVLDGSILSPREVMLRTVNSERYERIVLG
jgi:hypothetical protein